ncbi:hypothetical protein GCM10008171_32450 [Methylopila jiangsuensis]|uniref:Uncharacterized protein n=1 Tax=Methylopila jiangsuensis TaxID=586230 RepID=A0A9W6JKC4_9HYPH|nr:hypothetical protein [Methylopila jiangsuensis]MDR6284620.1 hypothetical protein [Methylopila jiangsuensis]GLK77991.1 hypothetical protein GCM10008171_32450 [Methylopila jiangsuensis]
MSHTQGPWVAQDGTTYGYEIISTSAPKSRRVVARLGGRDRDANAAFIVRAVNSHDALVEGLQEARSHLADLRDELFDTCTVRGDASTLDAGDKALIDEHDAVLARIDVALAKAEGREVAP